VATSGEDPEEAEPVARPARQQRTNRVEGRRHMVAAAIELLRTRPPDQITVRDVAEAAGHHHRFVQAWFGGKVGLFREAFDQLTADRAARTLGPRADQPRLDADTVLIVTLMNWLVATEPGCLDGPRPTPILDRTTAIYHEDYGLPLDVARLMALRLVGASIAAMLFPGPLGITEPDVVAIAELERELIRLLVASRPEPD
jgi:AcrR family transcriptional regulator